MIKSAALRSVVLYLAAFLILVVLVDPKRLQAKILNYLAQPIDYLVYFSNGEESLNVHKIREYAHYYETLIEYVPNAAAAYGMLAFCYYHMGKEAEAINLYQKAVTLQPHSFWFDYNLGVIYFAQKKYAKAIASFQKALGTPPQAAVIVMHNTKVFAHSGNLTRLINADHGPYASLEEMMFSHLKEGYIRAAQLTLLSSQRLRDSAPAGTADPAARLVIF